jgi:hypothetical protein
MVKVKVEVGVLVIEGVEVGLKVAVFVRQGRLTVTGMEVEFAPEFQVAVFRMDEDWQLLFG